MQENKQEEQEWRILHGKLTNDGGHNIFQADPPRRYAKRKRRAYIDKIVEADVSTFEKAKQMAANIATEKKNSVKPPTENIAVLPTETKVTEKMPLRSVFDKFYEIWQNEPKKRRRELLIEAMLPYHAGRKYAAAFVDQNLERKRQNEKSRIRRAMRKCNLNGFNYFVTFTYSDDKLTTEEFYKKLRAYLKNKVRRNGWKYYGVWEGINGEKRLHFHALMNIPPGTMPGELVKEKSYNTSRKRMIETTGNTEFNEKFGRSDVEEICMPFKHLAYNYVLKYLNKGGKAMSSRNCPESIQGWMSEEDLIGESDYTENQYIAFSGCRIAEDKTGVIVRVDERNPQEALAEIQGNVKPPG